MCRKKGFLPGEEAACGAPACLLLPTDLQAFHGGLFQTQAQRFLIWFDFLFIIQTNRRLFSSKATWSDFAFTLCSAKGGLQVFHAKQQPHIMIRPPPDFSVEDVCLEDRRQVRSQLPKCCSSNFRQALPSAQQSCMTIRTLIYLTCLLGN